MTDEELAYRVVSLRRRGEPLPFDVAVAWTERGAAAWAAASLDAMMYIIGSARRVAAAFSGDHPRLADRRIVDISFHVLSTGVMIYLRLDDGKSVAIGPFDSATTSDDLRVRLRMPTIAELTEDNHG